MRGRRHDAGSAVSIRQALRGMRLRRCSPFHPNCLESVRVPRKPGTSGGSRGLPRVSFAPTSRAAGRAAGLRICLATWPFRCLRLAMRPKRARRRRGSAPLRSYSPKCACLWGCRVISGRADDLPTGVLAPCGFLGSGKVSGRIGLTCYGPPWILRASRGGFSATQSEGEDHAIVVVCQTRPVRRCARRRHRPSRQRVVGVGVAHGGCFGAPVGAGERRGQPGLIKPDCAQAVETDPHGSSYYGHLGRFRDPPHRFMLAAGTSRA